MPQLRGIHYPLESQTNNYIVNGDMGIWQRGNSITITTNSATYAVDRYMGGAIAGTTSMPVSRSTDVPSNGLFPFSAKVQRTAGNTNTNLHVFGQGVESIHTWKLRGKAVTFSFWAKAGANFSGSIAVQVQTTTDTDISPFSYSTGTVNQVAIVNFTPTATWQQFTFVSTANVPVTANSLRALIRWTPSGTAGADDSFYITGLMLNEGVVAAPFKLFSEDAAGELRTAKRYYQRINSETANVGQIGEASGISTTRAFGSIALDGQMRNLNVANIVFSSSISVPLVLATGSTFTPTTVTLRSLSQYFVEVDFNTVSPNIAIAGAYRVLFANTTDWIAFSAEI